MGLVATISGPFRQSALACQGTDSETAQVDAHTRSADMPFRKMQMERLESRYLLAAELLLDHNKAEVPFEAMHFAELADELYFTTNGDVSRIEIWKTDGTSEGTQAVTSVGPNGGGDFVHSVHLDSVGGKLLIASTSRHPAHAELYVWDPGLSRATQLFDDGQGAHASGFGHVGDKVYFAVSPWTPPSSLVLTDGTMDGTFHISTGASILSTSNIVAVGDLLFYSAFSYNGRQALGYEPWVFNSKSGRSNLVKDINPLDGSSNPADYLVVGNTLYFTALTSQGRQVWRWDGKAERTWQVSDIPNKPDSAGPSALRFVGDSLYFFGDDPQYGVQLWATLGADRAVRVTSITDVQSGQLAERGNDLLFLSTTGETVFLWRWANNQVTLMDRFSGANPRFMDTEIGVLITSRTEHGNMLSLVQDDSIVHLGAVSVKEVLASANAYAFFSVDGQDGDELWITDGTSHGTKHLGALGKTGLEYGTLADAMVYSAERLGTSGLWIADRSGISLLKRFADRNGSSTVHSVSVLDDAAVFTVADSTGYREWWLADTHVTDGETATRLTEQQFQWGSLDTTLPGPSFFKVNDEYYFSAWIPRPRPQWPDKTVWRTDLTPQGTSLSSLEELRSIDPSFEDTGSWGIDRPGNPPPPWPHVEFAGKRYELATTSSGTYFIAGPPSDATLFELRDDGSTRSVTSLPRVWTFDMTGRSHRRLVAHGDLLYFGSDGGIWRSDGTAEGTFHRFALGAFLGQTRDRMFVASRREVWSINLREQSQRHHVGTISTNRYERLIGATDEALYVVADDGVHGREVWAVYNDGTTQLFDLMPGPASSNPSIHMHSGDFQLGQSYFFSADDGRHGQELWEAGPNGVRLYQDIQPGVVGSFPRIVTGLSNAVVFEANDGVHGREIWTVRAPEPRIGDIDLDGSVTFSDFIVLSSSFGKTGAAWTDGDLDGNGTVDMSDFVLLVANYDPSMRGRQ